MEGNHHTPSVIARLMGFDDLPPPQPIPNCKQGRVLSENYLQKTASIGLRERSSFSAGLCSRKNTQKHQVLKDVYGVEMPVYSDEKASYKAPGVMKQKYADSNYASMKEKHSSSKESEGLLSHKDHLPIYSQLAYQLSTKQLHDIQTCKSYCRPVYSAVSKSFSDIGRFAKTTTDQNTSRSLQTLEIGTRNGNVGEFAIDHLHKIKDQFEPKVNTCHPSTRIIVLQPSSGKSHDTKSHSWRGVESESVDAEYKEFSRHENGAVDNEIAERENTVDSKGSLKQSLRVPRTIAQTTSLVQHQDIPIFKLTPRAERINESFLKAEGLKSPSSSLFNDTKEDDTPQSISNRSFVAKEAKKQIIERWKLNNDFQEVEMAHRNHTFGEMLPMADLETRPLYVDSKHNKHIVCSSSSLQSRISGSRRPLGVSSKGGRKDNSPMPSHSLNSRIASGSPKSRIGNKTFLYGWSLRQKEAIAEKDSKSENQKQEDSLEFREFREFRRSSMLDQSSGSTSCCISSAYSQTVEVNEMILDKIDNMMEKSDLNKGSKHIYEVSDDSARSLTSTLTNANAENIRNSSGLSDDPQTDAIPRHLHIKDSDTSDDSVGQESGNEPSQRRSVSTKQNMVDPKYPQNLETNQPSPNSVLEPAFKEEILYTSELCDSFADLCSVAMQLKLIETNSEETYSEGSELAVSSDEDNESRSLLSFQDSEKILRDFKIEESRDFSYLVHVLDEASLHDVNLGMGFEKWHSLEFPVNSTVFDVLEKKYGKQASWLQSERKLLFDRINSGLGEILHSYLDIYSMQHSLKRKCRSTMRRNDIEEELWSMLVSLENEVCKDLSGKALGNKTKWLEVEEEIGSMCRELEEFLFDELVAELSCN